MLNFTAAVGGDTTPAGVTWTLEKQSGCANDGKLTVGSCGSLSGNAPFAVTFSAPAITATTSVVITATSVTDKTITKTVTVSVVLPPVFATSECNPINILPCTLTNGNNAVPYTRNFTFTGGVQPYTYTLVGSLPDCLKLNASSSSTTGTILGTPCGSGKSQFTIQVKDSGGAAQIAQDFIITIAPAPTLSVIVAPLPVGTLGSRYSGQISTNGGAAPLTWIAVGALPPGLSLNASTGQITGIPINESPAVTYPATYNFTIQVQDSRLPTPQKVPVPAAPFSITIQVPQPLLITTPPGPLASGTTGSSPAYSATLNASGGIPPYTWSVIQGQIPAGLTLSSHTDGTGSISGTPILATTASFTVQVADSALNPANGNPAPATNSATFSITITGSVANNTLLSGQYAFLFNGFDSDGPVALAGTLTANANGTITSGTVDSNRTTGVALGGSIVPPSTGVAGSTYLIGSDGRGTMELTFAFGANTPIVADYDLVLDSNGNAKFFEDYTAATNKDPKHTHGEGVLKHVVGPASFGNNNFSGNYAFVLPGYELQGKPAALAGAFHANGAQTISPGSSDFNDAGTFTNQSLSGDFTFLAGNRGTTALTFAPGAKPQVTLNFIFYFVTPSDLYFIEADRDTNGAPTMFRLSGEVVLQQTSTVFDQTVMQGVSVASGTGVDASGNASVFAGLLTSTLCNQNAAVSLIYDENDGGTINGGAVPPISFTAGTSCAITANGRVSFTGLGTTAAQTRVAVAYLTGPAQGFLLGSDAAVTTGRLEQQTSGPSFALTSFMGGYTITAPFEAEANVKSVVGQLTADGAGNIDGTVDEIDASGATSPNLAQLLGGTYTNPALGTPIGRGTLNTTGTVPSGFPADSIFYVVSPGSVRVISSVATDTHPQLILLDH
ncbi:MAG: Ig domain-containing protein [Candidatus Acidiferrales bacterium]